MKKIQVPAFHIFRAENHSRISLICVGLFAFIAVCAFIVTSQVVHGIGFPLDDAWIHQTYARNLALFREWSFIPGHPSAGSTAPLWSILLSIGYLFKLAPFLWTFFLGAVSLAALAVTGEKWFCSLNNHFNGFIPWAGIFLAGEWHLIWSAASGMETTLFALLIVVIFYFLNTNKKEWIIGLLIGISIWVRPDGITLLGPALFQYSIGGVSWKEKWKKSRNLILPFLIPATAYLLFNQLISNTWLPNTFYAKQAEYAVYQQIPILERMLSLTSLPLVGAGILLLPGFAFFIWRSIKNRSGDRIAVVIWWFGYNFLYALRLPVTYQHGRYLIPAMPVFFIAGIVGLADIYEILNHKLSNGFKTGKLASQRLRLLRFGWMAAVAALWMGMLGIGSFTFAQDVAIIDTEMVTTARWIAVNTPPGATIGAHDIGALGYFGNRTILDLAGLVSPDVIPFIRDENALGKYLTEHRADYLLTFPGWYPQLVKDRSILFQSSGEYSFSAGGEKMTVYPWP